MSGEAAAALHGLGFPPYVSRAAAASCAPGGGRAALVAAALALDFVQCAERASEQQGCLPAGVHEMRAGTLEGRFVVQLEEAVDVGASSTERYMGCGGQAKDTPAPARPTRTLKLQLTDGVRRVTAVEYRATHDLSPAMPAGCKLALDGVDVRRGMLLLSPANVAVLGGQVDWLEKARLA